jgi:class 3 adenylate cyclase
MGGGGQLQPGTRLGPYRVEAFLARGSTGEVYRARDERLGRSAAVKVLPPWLGEDERVRTRFLAEARAAASLDHPNVLPVYDAGDEGGILWIAMRLAEGRDLRELLRREGPLPPERAVALLAGIAAALDAAHAQGILHRDVKPGNILLAPGQLAGADHAYLADFGLATAAHGGGLTRTGEILGTADYVSPEQARGQPLDARSDVWSLAAVLFECLTGEPPFRRESEVASLTARLEEPAPAPSALRPDVAGGLDAVLARGLAREPAARYPSAGALMTAASTAVHGARLLGLLFADLRGYTAFAEREGDAKAAAVLARYRDLVRTAVARTGGAEIRTEGDSFYVIFPSVTSAIRTGLAIVGAAEAVSSADPSLPVRPGIGVHAGEPLEAPEGPIGAAVNTAARICALAAPGEVLVSATARELAGGSRDLAFATRGRLPAKGLAEPIEVWEASLANPVASGTETAQPTPPVARRPARRVVVAAGVGVLLVLAVGLAALDGRPPASPAASPGPAVASPAGSSATTGAAVGGPSSTLPATPAGPAVSPTQGPFPTEVEAAILAALPDGLARTCVRGGTRDDARLAGFVGTGEPVGGSRGGVTCRPQSGAARLYVMAWSFVTFTGGGGSPGVPAEESLGFLEGRHMIPDGSCATDSQARERWVGPIATGLLACMNPYDGRPWIYFTFGGGRYLAFATRDDSNYDALYQWWQQLKTFLP